MARKRPELLSSMSWLTRVDIGGDCEQDRCSGSICFRKSPGMGCHLGLRPGLESGQGGNYVGGIGGIELRVPRRVAFRD